MILNKSSKTLMLVFGILITSNAQAQDSHYWGNQYGTRSALLGGAVVGGVRDTSASYYNPGALGFIKNESLSVSANALKYETVTLDNGAGTGDDLDSEEYQAIPLLVSGIYKFEGAEEHTIGYSLLSKNNSKLSFDARRDSISDLTANPGLEEYVGQYTFNSDINEYWGGVSYAYQANDTYSFGLTNFLALRNESAQETTNVRALNQNDPFNAAAITDRSRYIDYTSLRLLWKAGVAADYGKLKVGLVGTTPSVNLYGDGTTSADLTSAGVDINGDGRADTLIANDRQDNLDAEYRTPFSVAAGAAYEVTDTTKLNATVEWFGRRGAYNVMVAEDRDFIRPTGAGAGIGTSGDFLTVSNSADAVVNWAVGAEQVLTEKVNGFFSFRSDYETVTNGGRGTSLGVSNWDIYHATVGATYRRENSELGIGLVYSFGDTNNASQPVNFENPTTDNLLLGEPGKTSVDYEAVSIILGYTYFIQ